MTTKTYALLDTHAVGPLELLDIGRTVITCAVPGTDYARAVRATEGFSSGQHYLEFTAYGEGTMAGKVAVGIGTATASLSQRVGFGADSVGFKLGDGDIWVNDISVATVAPTDKEVVCGLLLDADADTATFFVANSIVAVVALTPGQTWYPMGSVGCDTASNDLNVYFVFGQNAFTYPQPGGLGWFTESGGFGGVRVCGQTGYLTRSSDTPANTLYVPDMVEFNDFATKHDCSVWPWSNQSSGATYGSLALANADGRYDYLTKIDPRDAKVTMRLVPVGAPFSESFVVATTNVNNIGSDGEAKMRLDLSDTIATLQGQLQTLIFPPYVDPGIAGRPFPILLGAARNVPILLKDQENRLFQASDAPINNIGVLRDMGDRLDPNAAPPDYTLTSDGAAVQTQVLPQGKLAGDFSSLGTQYIIPGADDALGGQGTLATWTTPTSPPDGWTIDGVSSGTQTRLGTATSPAVPQNYASEITTAQAWWPPLNKFGFVQHLAANLEPGATYNFTFKIYFATGAPPVVPGVGKPFGFRLVSSLAGNPSSSITPDGQPINASLWQGDDVYTFTYTVPAGLPRDLYLSFAAADGVVAGTAAGSATGIWYLLQAEKLVGTVDQVPLQPMTLTAYVQAIATRAAAQGLDVDWSECLVDTAAIDARTGYQGIGNWISDPTTIEQALREVCDSYCAVLFTDHLGRPRIRQLIDPATIADGDIVLELSGTEIEYPVNCSTDAATGLTDSMLSQENYYIYTDNDFVSDFNEVTGIDGATRMRFKQQGQYVSVATVGIASFYNFARKQPAIMSKFDYQPDADTEINRVCGFFSGTPNFYKLTVLFDGATAETLAHLIFGDGIKVTYPRYGLNDGKKLLVIDTNILPGDFSIELTCWAP